MSQKKSNPGNDTDRASALAAALGNLQEQSTELSNRFLVALSDLNAEELKTFDSAWKRLKANRKRALLSRLKELSEDNVQYNFGAVFKQVLADADERVRQEAIEGLWEDNEPSLIRPLINILENDKSSAVRKTAAIALQRFSLMAECHKIEDDNIDRISQPLLKIFNNDESLPVRGRALEALAPFSLPEVTQAIWAAYRRDEPEMKASAIRAMGTNCDLLWLPTVMRELGSDNAEMRYEAASAAGALGEVEASASLIELLGDPDPDVRLAAVQALGSVGGAEAKRALRHAQRGKDKAMKEAATTALTEIELFEEPFSTQAQP